MSTTKRLVDVVSVMTETCHSHNDAMREMIAGFLGSSICEIMDVLLNIEEVTCDPDFHGRCCNLLMYKAAREMFVTMWGKLDLLLSWLRFAAYNPPDFLND